MNHFGKFYALSAIYFGLASPVGAQPPAAPEPSAAQSVEQAPYDHFEHPMLEQRSGSEMRLDEEDGQRIQRRSMQDTRRDGDMRRNVLPGASDDGDGSVLEGDVRERRPAPAERRRPN